MDVMSYDRRSYIEALTHRAWTVMLLGLCGFVFAVVGPITYIELTTVGEINIPIWLTAIWYVAFAINVLGTFIGAKNIIHSVYLSPSRLIFGTLHIGLCNAGVAYITWLCIHPM